MSDLVPGGEWMGVMQNELQRKKRVLQLNKLYYPRIGGIERTVQQVAEGLSEYVEMSVLTCAEGIHGSTEQIHGVTVYRLPSLFRVDSLPIPMGYVRKLRKLGKEQDIVHLHMPFPIGDLACFLSGYQGKLVLWWHSDVVRQKKMMHLYKPLMLWTLRRADAIVVATQGHIDGSAYLEPFREKCVIIPFGVDRRIEKAADDYIMRKSSTDETMRMPFKKRLRFLFVGRLVYYKGCEVLLRAFCKVKNAELVMVGSGVLEEEYRKFVREQQLEDRVQLLGEISEESLYQQFADCDVFVLPSVMRSEAFGLVQIEAMAFGKPVINTRLPSGVPYVSLDRITGLTVRPGDADELAYAMNWMVEHPEERRQMGMQARKRMKQEYRMETMLERIRELYRSL